MIIGSFLAGERVSEQIRVSRLLGHAVVATLDGDRVYLHAVPQRGER